jgi:hypothetical protein
LGGADPGGAQFGVGDLPRDESPTLNNHLKLAQDALASVR